MKDFKPALTLVLVVAICAGLVSFVHIITREPIAAQQIRMRNAARVALLPEADDFSEISGLTIPEGVEINNVYTALSDGEIIAYVGEIIMRGYEGPMNIMVSMSETGEVLGVRILSHTETPGLGALAARDIFTNQFRGFGPFSVSRQNSGNGEILAITGATITTQAVTDAVNTFIYHLTQHLNYVILK